MQLQRQIVEEEFSPTPLDYVEDVLSSYNWVFNRVNAEELVVQVTGKGCDYRLFFIWHEDMDTIQFHCQYDIIIPEANFDTAARTLMNVNAGLWLGHFDLEHKTGTPSFRYTALCHAESMNSEKIEAMIDVALAQCERFFSAFNVLSQTTTPDEGSLSLALMETHGES